MTEFKYSPQLDAFSCGFYVVCLVLSYSVRFGDFPPFSYRDANTVLKQFEISEIYRTAAVKSYFNRVDEVYRTRGDRMTEGDVTRSIILTRLGIVPNSEHDADVAVSLGDSSIDEDSEVNQ